jgi:hypothetical protein
MILPKKEKKSTSNGFIVLVAKPTSGNTTHETQKPQDYHR